jgi:LacI family transcriptional regulator
LSLSKSYRIALLIETSTSWGVRLIRGIGQFAQERGDWLIHVEPRGRYERSRIPAGWKGDGIIARINQESLAREIVAAAIPAVNVSWFTFDGPNICRTSASERESGDLAADYFLSLGLRRFAYCGPLRRPGYEDQFAAAYSERLAAAGYPCEVYPALKGDQRTIPWDEQLNSLVGWLKELPRPTGLLCWSAWRGRQVTEACQYAGIRVPDEVAVLGGEHDDLMAMISTPPLSTIEQPAERIGYEAAALLQKMMQGEEPPSKAVMFSPTRVVVRQSTDILAVEDDVVRKALRVIHQQACSGVNVSDIVSQLMIARRALEQRFVQHLGRTPAVEIRRVRIEAAKKLLVETDQNMAQIARATGFGEQDLFSRTFRRNTGMTPTEFRTIHRGAQ